MTRPACSPLPGLARVEAARMARHPLVLAGGAASIALFAFRCAGYAPVLQRDSVYVAGSLLPLAAATSFAANLTGLRDRRLGTAEVVASAPHGSAVAGARLAACLVPVAYAVLLSAAGVLALVVAGGVGRPAAWELATGPALVAAAGAAGLALARAVPSPLAPLPLLVAGVVATFVLDGDALSRRRWLAPYVDFTTRVDAVELARRPAALHAVAVLGLAAALAVAAVGRRPRRAGAGMAAGLAVAVLAGGAQLRPASAADVAEARRFALDRGAVQRCSARGAVDVCLYPGYTGWADDYGAVAASVLGGLPIGDAGRLVLEQRPPRLVPDAWPAPVRTDVNGALGADRRPGVLQVGMDRVLPSGALDLRSAVGMFAAGLPVAPGAGAPIEGVGADPTGGRPPDVYCDGRGQGRVAAGLWAAIRGAPEARRALGDLVALASGPDGASYRITAGGVDVGPVEAALAVALAEAGGTVAATLADRWGDVTSPATSTADLADLTGLDVPVVDEPPDQPPPDGPRCP